ncbi:hypothetical protein SARC_06589 [Sphaeroforma arctica JP610]|uniref:ubiquitinyl hydrolase 1 n=1 Tax=Sphaeroforma arctica JP610 TaxID=667725 RepID=A0A0L0FW68_9EUKA|nr:hypothetical protein SARC_06589 [Sphaeroforma arctica JP610]KNC81065.1 hypothetical protein SARC_06589 [Sphaeroforma arctica JP610]|eukprot:XP_014154967.1 hypothetical protein SARC_06589 [Sphaeroforma arctica JP610]
MEATPSDEAILKQRETLEAIQMLNPMVSVPMDIRELAKEYEDGSAVYVNKIENLSKTYKSFRRCRRDGNCLYRAVSYALHEKLLQTESQTLQERCQVQIVKSKPALIEAGFQEYVFEDFYEATLESWMQVKEKDSQWVHELFNDSEMSNAIGLYYRFMTAVELRTNASEYIHFLEDGTTVEKFCNTQVECYGKEADNIQIAALCRYLKIRLKIVHLDQSTGDECNVHDIGREDADDAEDSITLLYRPDHYDILYETCSALSWITPMTLCS